MKRFLALALLAAAVPAARGDDAGSFEGRSTAEWLKTLGGKDEKERARAARSLAMIGKPASEAIPALAKALLGSPKNEDLRVNAALALGKVAVSPEDQWKSRIPDLPGKEPGPGADPAPAPAPAPPDPAAAKLSESVRKTAVPALVKALSDPATDVRINAAFALGLLGEDAAEAAKALLKSLTEKSDGLRANAAVALASMPGAAEDAVPALAKMLSDPHASAANAAANGLKARGAKALPVLKAVDDALARDVEKPRYQGPAGLAGRIPKGIGGGPFGGAPPLSVNLCLLLGGLGKDAAPALPTLFKALKAASGAARNAAIQAIGDIHSDPEKSVAALVGALGDALQENRGLAAFTLGEFGPDARSALPALEKLRDSSGGDVCQNAQAAIDRIGGKAVATGDGEVAPARPGGLTTHGGSGGDTTEIWR